MVGIPGRPNSTSSPKVPSPTAIMMFATTMTSCGAIRSAMTPPISMNSSDGAICAAST